MRRALHVLLAASALLAASSHCDGGGSACSLIGCLSQVTTSVSLPIALSELEGATVTICFNGECETGTIQLDGSGGTFASCEFDDPLRRRCEAEQVDGELTLEMAFILAEEDAPKNGDSYVFSVHPAQDPAADLVPEVSGSVDYEVTRPNGPNCDPACRTAEL